MVNNGDASGPVVSQVTLAGGCFWGIEAGFRGVEGILATIVGYTGGNVEEPEYTLVSTGTTGHVEAVRIAYDPVIISLKTILNRFFSLYDPVSVDGQPVSESLSPYRSFIFCHTEEDCRMARTFIKEEEESGKYAGSVVTVVRPAEVFWPAEDYHQKYYEKLENRYKKPLF